MKKKDKWIVVRVTNEELETIKAKANKMGLSISGYLRMLGLKSNEQNRKAYCDKCILINSSKLEYIGETEIVTKKYLDLFSDETSKNLRNKIKRWGDGSFKLEKISIDQKNNQIIIKVVGIAKKEISKLVPGLHIRSDDQKNELFAFNSSMLNIKPVTNLKNNSKVETEWVIDNVLGTGRYSISCTYGDGEVTYDWVLNAGSFEVNKDEQSTTSIMPKVNLKSKVH